MNRFKMKDGSFRLSPSTKLQVPTGLSGGYYFSPMDRAIHESMQVDTYEWDYRLDNNSLTHEAVELTEEEMQDSLNSAMDEKVAYDKLHGSV